MEFLIWKYSLKIKPSTLNTQSQNSIVEYSGGMIKEKVSVIRS